MRDYAKEKPTVSNEEGGKKVEETKVINKI